MGLLVVYAIVRSVVAAATKPFWFDELITLILSSLPSMKDVWGALWRALDGQPPLFDIIERNFAGLFQNKEIALRLPSILAFPCTLLCVFAYVRKRSGNAIGLLCALFLLLSSLFHHYAVEARPYSLMVASIAFALICYQRVASPLWAILFGLSLLLAESLHYYAIFAMIPFWAGEFVYLLSTRRFRWLVWAALVLGPVPLLLFWPLLANIRAFYGTHLFGHYGLSSIPLTYGSFFLTGGAFGFALVAVCAAGVVGARLLPGQETKSEDNGRDPAEACLLLTFLFLPFPATVLTHLMHGAMLDRYVLASILGVVLSLACVMSLARPRVVLMFGIFVLSTLAIHEFTFWRSFHSMQLENPAAPVEALLKKAGHPDLPCVVSDGLIYVQLAYYASPEVQRRLLYLEDEQKAVQFLGTDTVDRNFPVLKLYMPVQVAPYSEFVATHRTFLLYVMDAEGFNWLPGYLQTEASSVQVLGTAGAGKMYLITMKENPTH